MKRFLVALVCLKVTLFLVMSDEALAGIHHAPVIVAGVKIRSLTRYPLSTYRVFRTGKGGEAIPIPFQIDEKNEWDDYIMTHGKNLQYDKSNGLFDLQDELVLMGDDVGPIQEPTRWPQGRKPAILKEVRFDFDEAGIFAETKGAIYVGVYFTNAPALAEKSYVVFNVNDGIVKTSRFRYKFDQKNYLVVEGIDMARRDSTGQEVLTPIVSTSTFFMRADLKYFLTFTVNHRDINSSLEAYKVGPVRTIVRVIFFYQFLKINFELGMYTEVSIFSNSVLLPAVMYNPLKGDKNLNSGSGFYYGFALSDNPSQFKINTNIPKYEPANAGAAFFDRFLTKPKIDPLYWLSLSADNLMMYFEVAPSPEMLTRQNLPSLYLENQPAAELYKSRRNDIAKPLGESPVNLGLHFDLTKFTEGEHKISFRLLFDNYFNEAELKSYPHLPKWRTTIRHL